MNVFQRAWCSTTRNRARTLLLILAFFLIGNLVILGLGVSEASENAKILTRKKMRAAVDYKADTEGFIEHMDEIEKPDENTAWEDYWPWLDEETVSMLAGDERVKAVNYMAVAPVYSDGRIGIDYSRNHTDAEYDLMDLLAYASYSPNMIEFTEGTYVIAEGSMFTQKNVDNGDDVCVISDELADKNNLKIGDLITFASQNTEELELKDADGKQILDTDDYKMECTVIGIFHANEAYTAGQARSWSSFEYPANRVFVPFSSYQNYCNDVIAAMYRDDPSMALYGSLEKMQRDSKLHPSSAVFLLKDPLDVEPFIEEYTPKLKRYTYLDGNNELFQKLSRPLDTISYLADMVVKLVILNAVVIITLISAISIKNRQFEIGEYIALGVSKWNVLWQMFLELVIAASIGFACSAISGSMLAGKVGDMVLSYQMDNGSTYSSGSSMDALEPDYFTDISSEDFYEEYHVEVSPETIGGIFLSGYAVILVSLVIPGMMIMKLNVREILLEQN